MVSLSALWLPILLSAVAVFVASSILHMVLTYHRSDFAKLGDEDKVRTALRAAGVTPGVYMFPNADSPKEMRSEAMRQRFAEGPVGILTIAPNGLPSMGKYLALWFVYTLLISLLAAYLAAHTLAAGASYLAVFRVIGTAALLAYSVSELCNSIWRRQPWKTTAKAFADGIIYALVTAGVFGWLWPA
jgi:hypothetical protein